MPEPITYMDLDEFVEGGFLQEANRLFFHPLGLALEVQREEDGTRSLSGIWDYRKDEEGMLFSKNVATEEKAHNVRLEFGRHAPFRHMLFGSPIQPIVEVPDAPSETKVCEQDGKLCAAGCTACQGELRS